MPFAYAGTRRRRNRDRRRSHDTLESSAAQPDSARPTDARDERDPTRTRSAPDEERATASQGQRGEMPPGVGSEDLLDPGSRDPDAPPVDNRS